MIRQAIPNLFPAIRVIPSVETDLCRRCCAPGFARSCLSEMPLLRLARLFPSSDSRLQPGFSSLWRRVARLRASIPIFRPDVFASSNSCHLPWRPPWRLQYRGNPFPTIESLGSGFRSYAHFPAPAARPMTHCRGRGRRLRGGPSASISGCRLRPASVSISGMPGLPDCASNPPS